MFEDVGYIPHFRAVTYKCGQFRVVSFLFGFWRVVLRFVCCLSLVIILLGKLLLRAMLCMVFLYVRLSFVSGIESIQLM